MNIQVVDIPNDKGTWGRFHPLLDQVELLPANKCLRIDRLDIGEVDSLRQAARSRGYRIAVRNTPDATFLWKKEAKQ